MKDEGDHLQRGVSVSPIMAVVAGSISGLAARTVTAPLDILKIRLQLSSHPTTISKTLREIYRNEGVRAFWKGNMPASFMYIIYGSTQFASYSIANTALSHFNETQLQGRLNSNIHNFLVGSTAGMSSTLVSYPLDLLRTRLASNKDKGFSRSLPVMSEIYHESGITGFYKGLKPSLASVTLQMGVMFQTYEFCKDLVRKNDTKSPFVVAIDPFCGLISGLVAKTVTFPLDLIRKRLQMVDRGHSTTAEVMKHILKTAGPRGLFSGLSPALLKSGPTSAVSLWMYEYSITVFNKLAAPTLD